MLAASDRKKDPETWLAVRLFAISYIFQLRLPSEALPIALNKIGGSHVGQQAILKRVGEELHLELECRKTHQKGGSLIRRPCWCTAHLDTCPVHCIWPDLAVLVDGTQPWAWITPAKALASLRETLRQLGVSEFSKYGTHALRKGHTMDMAESGEVPEEALLYYGQWKSKTSMRPYLDESIAERNRVARAHAAMPDEVPVCPPPDGDLEGSSSDDDLGWGRQLE